MRNMSQQPTRQQSMLLFSSDESAHCHMVRIVLAEKGVSYDLRQVNLDDTPEDLKELNPYDETPTLIDRDLVLYQHQIIVEYLDERFPHPPLMPVDPVSRSRTRLMLYRIERDWYSLANAVARKDKGSDEARKHLRDSILSALPLFEQKPYFLNEEYSMIDCALAPLLWRLPIYGIELPSAAKSIVKYTERVFQRAAFRASLTKGEQEFRP